MSDSDDDEDLKVYLVAYPSHPNDALLPPLEPFFVEMGEHALKLHDGLWIVETPWVYSELNAAILHFQDRKDFPVDLVIMQVRDHEDLSVKRFRVSRNGIPARRIFGKGSVNLRIPLAPDECASEN